MDAIRTLLRPEEWATSIGISRSKAYRLIRDKKVPIVMVGASQRIDPTDALAALKSGTAPTGERGSQ